jgi:hypothetical protein
MDDETSRVKLMAFDEVVGGAKVLEYVSHGHGAAVGFVAEMES